MLYSYAVDEDNGILLKDSNAHTIGNELKGDFTLSLPNNNLNKAIFTFKIKCSESVSDFELEELLKLSKVTKTTEETSVPTVEELKNADGTTEEKKIYIIGTENFFKEENSEDKSDLIRFKLQCVNNIDQTLDLQLSEDAITTTTDTKEGKQASKTFKVYNTTDRKSKLYLQNDNNEKILTFEIPLDLPEFTDIKKKIKSFKIFIAHKNEIFDNGYQGE